MNSDAPIINWKRIIRGIPSGRKAANDRAPTIEEIRKVSEYHDRRIKPIVYIMASSGIRLGAWDSLQWKHVTSITNDNGEVIAAKLLIYAGDSEEYYCFITTEAERFISSLVGIHGSQHPVSTDGGTWYPDASKFAKIKHHLHSFHERKASLSEQFNTLKIEQNVLMIIFHVEKLIVIDCMFIIG
jgi:hypothetical protein